MTQRLVVNRRPAWEKQFLRAIHNGYLEKTAANLAGVGSGDVKVWQRRSTGFAERYEEAKTNALARPRR
jgi:hypothetical protein